MELSFKPNVACSLRSCLRSTYDWAATEPTVPSASARTGSATDTIVPELNASCARIRNASSTPDRSREHVERRKPEAHHGRDRRKHEDQKYLKTFARRRERKSVEDRRERVGVELHAGHGRGGRRRDIDVPADRIGHADQNRLARERASRNPALQHVEERVRTERSRWSTKIHPGMVFRKVVRVHRVPLKQAGRPHGERLQPHRDVDHAPQHVVGIWIDRGARENCAGCSPDTAGSRRRAATQVLVRGEEHRTVAPDRREDRTVVDRIRRVQELKVERDQTRGCRVQAVDQLGVVAARNRQPRVECFQRVLVHRHDHNRAPGRHGATQPKPRVDRLSLDPAQRSRLIRDERE
jgi:hypothetical protein